MLLSSQPSQCTQVVSPASLFVEACLSCVSDSLAAVLMQELVTPLETTPANTQGDTDQALASLSSCLQDLPQNVLLGLSQSGAAHRMPLTVALVSERARQQAAALDFMAWRDLVAGISTVRPHCWGRLTARFTATCMYTVYTALSMRL